MSTANRTTKIINGLDITALKKLIEKLISKLPCRNVQDLFTFEEREKLISIFNLSSGDLTIVLQQCTNVLQQAAYEIVKPDQFRQKLMVDGFSENVFEVFVIAYQEIAKDLINKLKNISISPCQLQDFNYLLNVEVASSDRSKINKPIAGLQFVVGSGDSGKEAQSFVVDMDHQQLYAFYDKLEEIQKQLDSIMG